MNFEELVKERKEREAAMKSTISAVGLAGLSLIVALVIGISAIASESPERALIKDVAEYIATHPKTDSAVSHVSNMIEGCGIPKGFYARPRTGPEAWHLVLQDQPPGVVMSTHRITYGDSKGLWYTAMLEISCS